MQPATHLTRAHRNWNSISIELHYQINQIKWKIWKINLWTFMEQPPQQYSTCPLVHVLNINIKPHTHKINLLVVEKIRMLF